MTEDVGFEAVAEAAEAAGQLEPKRTRAGYQYFAVSKTDEQLIYSRTDQKALLEAVLGSGYALDAFEFFRGLKVALRVEYRL